MKALSAVNEPHPSFSRILVSVIVPMFTAASYIRECVASVTRQSHQNLEVIVVDDGSQDESAEIVTELMRDDTRIRLIRQRNLGVSTARNVGLDLAQGEYICFVDSDDWLAGDFVAHLLALAITHNADMALSRVVLKRATESPAEHESVESWSPAEATANLLYAEIKIGCWNKLFRRTMIHSAGLRFSPKLYMGEGLKFITSAAQSSRTIVATDRAMYYYRRDNCDSATTQISLAKMENALLAIDDIRANLTIRSAEVMAALSYHQWITSFYAIRAARLDKSLTKGQGTESRYRKHIASNGFRVIVSSRVSLKRKLQALLIWTSPSIALCIHRIRSSL